VFYVYEPCLLVVKDEEQLLVLDKQKYFITEIEYKSDTFVHTADENARIGKIKVITPSLSMRYHFRVRKEGAFKTEYDNICSVLSNLQGKIEL